MSFVPLARAALVLLVAAGAPAARAAAQTEGPSERWTGYVTGVFSPAGLHDLGATHSVGGSAALLRGTGTALEYGLEALYEQSGPFSRSDVQSYCRGDAAGCQTPCAPEVAGCIVERTSAYQMSNKFHLLGVVRLHATSGAVRPYAETGMGVYVATEHYAYNSVSTGGDPNPYTVDYDEQRSLGGGVLAMGLGVEVPVARRVAFLGGLRVQGHLGEGLEVIHPTFSAGVRLQ